MTVKSLNLIQSFLVQNLSWFYVLSVAAIFLSAVYFGASRFGDIRLGPDHSVPRYSYFSWFAMLFSAGMGIGIMFFGVAEPVMHFSSPPIGPGGTAAAAEEGREEGQAAADESRSGQDGDGVGSDGRAVPAEEAASERVLSMGTGPGRPAGD